MKSYVADAVTFLYYLFDKLPINSDKAFREAELGEAVIYLPTIAAAELFYLFDSKKWSEKQVEMRTVMEETLSYLYYPFNKEVIA